MKKLLLLILGVMIGEHSFAQRNPIEMSMDSSWNQLKPNTFTDLVKANNLSFVMPVDFEQTAIKRNYNVFYQYAIKHKDSNFEIRIFVKSFKGIFKDTVSFNPNKFSFSFLSAMALDASGNILPNVPEIDLFPKVGVNEEYNADWGASTAFAPNSEFGKGFSFCVLNCLRKDSRCEVYIFYMFDDFPNQRSLLEKTFYLIKFKD